ncbi:HAMP domain-containing sensor histidine kinase [Microbacterium sp. H1-D42]|uniref:sensor histidine kinase n=1 Tax=Microbacterium sp. H1-D42 TaxID=2925844 RepID=UPI001F533AC2|nr:HAMP domain-containing sensor histidine kinase [Microbacterium sp. H1-D42]UNK69559.1 HAMP domain-containing histidine kinase [Microbacterium sp. H1-D42]
MPSPTSAEPAPVTRRYRVTVRTRLALTYSALLIGSGVVMLTLVYIFMRFVPTYALEPGASVPAVPAEPTPPPSETGATDAAEITTPARELLITSADQMLNVLLIVSVVVLVVLGIIGVAVGWAVAGRMLRPLRDINDAVERAAHGDLGQRIGLEGPRDEISELATNFDEMLARLERSFAASRRFAANASHELLTPLATNRAMLDVAIAQHPASDDAEVFERLRMMNERGIQTAQALLELARVEASPVHLERVDLGSLVEEIATACRAEAAERGVDLRLDLSRAPVGAEPVLMRQLIVNLLQNSIRHNLAQGGTTEVRTDTSAGTARLIVSNTGAQLSPEAVAELVEPFVRGQGRRSTTASEGHGLGLSIVAAIVERFGGELDLAARDGGGLRVTATFPAR